MKNENNINHIAKEILAKLIAQENLTVEHRNVQTAAFDTKNRVLVLPTYKDITEDIYDLFIGHECSHALNTPATAWELLEKKNKEYPGYQIICNIIEDARIEKLIKRKLPGLAKSFFYAYKQLHEKDFFGVKSKDLSKIHLMDKLNLHFKVGISGNLNIQFTEEEKDIVREIEKAETFEQVVAIADKLAKKFKQEQKESGQGSNKNKKQKVRVKRSKQDGEEGEEQERSLSDAKDQAPQPIQNDEDGEAESLDSSDEQSESFGEDSETEGDENSKSEENDGENESDSESSGDSDDESDSDEDSDGDSGDESDSDEDSDKDGNSDSDVSQDEKKEEMGITYSNEKKNYEKFVDQQRWTPKNQYVNIPEFNRINFDGIIVDYKEIHAEIRKFYRDRLDGSEQLTFAASKFQEFRNQNTPIVSYLVKEFELKKSADEFSRTLTSKTGLLDTNKLYSYKYSDDVFLKKEVVQDGKNHGLMMFIDCSDSMSQCIADTFEQLINLVMFCRKANIPFEVYGFADRNRGYYFSRNENGSSQVQKKENDFFMEDLVLKNYFSSRMSAAEFGAACINIQAVINGFRRVQLASTYCCRPDCESLTSTPLNSTIICAMKMVTDFRKRYNLQKVNTVFLTDGESNYCSYWQDDGRGYLTASHVGGGYNSVVFRNTKTRKEYKKSDSNSRRSGETECLYNCLRDMTGTRVLGFYLEHHTSNVRNLIANQMNQSYRSDKVKSEAKKAVKDGSYVVKKSFGYDELYVILTKEMKIDDQKVDIDRSKISSKAVAKAFTSALKGRIHNRVLLSKFIEQIA